MPNLIYYKDFKAKESDFKTTLIKTTAEFDSWFNDAMAVSGGTVIYRGLNEARYKLYTSAQRIWIERGFVETIGDGTNIFSRFVQNLINNCREWQGNLLTKYYTELDQQLSDLALLAIMQHYEMPTPLVDFTRDMKTALYFAIRGFKHVPSENAIDDYVSLYSVDLDANKDYVLSISDLCTKDHEDALSYRNLADRERLILIDSNDNKELKLIHFSNFNIIKQQGVFLFNYHPWKYIATVYQNEIQKKFFEYPEMPKEIPLLKEAGCVNIHKSLMNYILVNYLDGFSDKGLFPSFQDLKEYSLNKTFTEINKIV